MTHLAARSTRALDQLRVQAGTTVADTACLSVHEDDIAGQLVYKLTAEVLAERLETGRFERTVRVPATWWEHLKRDHAPAWFTRRFPVRYTPLTLAVDLSRWATYPHATVPLPGLGPPVVVDNLSSDVRWGR